MIVGHVHRPAATGSRSAGRDVAAQREQRAGAAGQMGGARPAIGGQRLGGRAEVQLHPGGHADGRAPVRQLDRAPERAPLLGHARALVQRLVGGDRRESLPVAVIAQLHQAASQGGIHGAVGDRGRSRCQLQRLQQPIGDRHPLPAGSVHERELGVVAKPAGRSIDLVDLALGGRSRRVAGSAGDAQHGVGAERWPCLHADGGEAVRRRGHDPPETTGAGAGVGAACGGAAGGLIGCVVLVGVARCRWRRADRCSAPRGGRLTRRERELVEVGTAGRAAALAWPGNARAAALARNTVSATMAVAIPRLSQRSRRSEASRRFEPGSRSPVMTVTLPVVRKDVFI